jgi:hypothetical protein
VGPGRTCVRLRGSPLARARPHRRLLSRSGRPGLSGR